MKKRMGLFSIIAGAIIFCSVSANAQQHYGNHPQHGNSNHHNNWNNNRGSYNNNCGNGGGYGHYNNYNHHVHTNYCHTNQCNITYGYTYPAPQVVIVAPARPMCAPRPYCGRW